MRQRKPGTQRFTFLSTCGEPWGGSEELWWAAACALRERGHAVDVLKGILPDAHPRIRHLRRIGCFVRSLDSGLLSRLATAANAVLPARWSLASERCRMVVAAMTFAIRRPRAVVISQGLNYEGSHFARVCRALRIEYVLISQKASDTVWPPDEVREYHRNGYGAARSVIFVAERNRRLTEEQLGIKLPHARVLPNPVLAGAAGALPWPEAPLRLACVARLDIPEKGQDLLLHVLGQRQWQERPVHVSFVGEGRHHAALAELAQQLQCRSVSFTGHLPDVEDVWREHHALVLPSRAEGMPLALVEAMMCGRPALATDVGGNAELVRDGVTGMLAAGATVPALSTALESFWSRRAEWQQMGAAAAQHVRAMIPDNGGELLADHLTAGAGMRTQAVPL